METLMCKTEKDESRLEKFYGKRYGQNWKKMSQDLRNF